MFRDQTPILEMLIDELRASQPEVAELFDQLANDHDPEHRRNLLRQLGILWHDQGGNPEVLVELGLALCDQHNIPPGTALAELLLAFGASREQQRSRDWETHLMRRMAELKGLHRVISAANSTLDLETSMQQVVETVAEVIAVEACSVYLYDRASDDLTLRATFGLNRDAIGQVRLPMGQGITGAAAREGRPISIRDARRDTRFIPEPALGEEPFRAMLAVPIVLFSAERFQFGAANLQGVITVQSYAMREFTDEEISFVETVAGELAFFIVNAQLFQQTDERLHQKVRELTTLQQVSKRIAEQLNLEELLKLIVARAVELAKADRADIIRFAEDGSLILAVSHGGDAHMVPDFMAQAVSQGRPLAVLNAFNDARFPDLAQLATREQFVSLFCMPLRLQHRTIGAICLYTRDARHFDYEQVRMLSTFADEAAIAIENARLYEESQRALKIKSAMLQEMHHRVRNNLQTISALLAMQQRRLEPHSRGATALRDSVARIQAIAAVHNLLCRQDIGITTVHEVANQIVESAQVSLVEPDRPISFQLNGDPITIGSHEATVLAIVLNETVNNAIYHGLASEGGRIEINTAIHESVVTVEVRDDGPQHPPANQPPISSGLGLQIIRTLVSSDLEGEFELLHGSEWTTARVRFPHRISDKV
ncbi:MAG: GAF domain-containing protein [Roseiflexaceae bacterium]